MLSRLEINNFAVISHAVFEPENHFNVLSGETGAGKSLIIDAISLIMGIKASKSLIRSNCDCASVEAVFDVSDFEMSDNKDDVEEFNTLLSENGIEIEDDTLIIERKISIDGKSISRINGKTVVLSLIKRVSSFLIDIHGQHDTQRIFDEKFHTSMLDSYAGESVYDLQCKYKLLLNEYKNIIVEIKSLGSSPDSINLRKSALSACIEEISSAAFIDGEEESLREKKSVFSSKLKIAEMIYSVNDELNLEDDNGSTILSHIENAKSTFAKVAILDPEYDSLSKKMDKFFYEAEGITSDIDRLASSIDFDEVELNRIDSRIQLLLDLKSKYGKSISEINEHLARAREELDSLSSSESRLVVLRSKRVEVEKNLVDVAEKLSSERKSTSIKLSSLIMKELNDLCMPNARFEVMFVRRAKDKFFSSTGIDDIAFMFSANPGQDLKPLSSIISGGEASRVMLAIKSILSRVDSVSTLIFDEIDTGISGHAATSIASKLVEIGKYHQVLCVTHTAQIAAAASSNYVITKNVEDDNTNTSLISISGNKKVEEVSRLLSGSNILESIDLAKQLIDRFVR